MLENDIDLSFLVSASLTCDHEVEEVDTLVRTVEVDSVRLDKRCCCCDDPAVVLALLL